MKAVSDTKIEISLSHDGRRRHAESRADVVAQPRVRLEPRRRVGWHRALVDVVQHEGVGVHVDSRAEDGGQNCGRRHEDLSDVDLRNDTGLNQEQIDEATGNQRTLLPDDL